MTEYLLVGIVSNSVNLFLFGHVEYGDEEEEEEEDVFMSVSFK
jgi:hypothetical protein